MEDKILEVTNSVIELLKSNISLDSIIYAECQEEGVLIICDTNKSYKLKLEEVEDLNP